MSDTSNTTSDFRALLAEKPAVSNKLRRLLRLPAVWQALNQASVRQYLVASEDISLASVEGALRQAPAGEPKIEAAIELIDRGLATQTNAAIDGYVEGQQPSFSELEAVITFSFIHGGNELLEDVVQNDSPVIRRAALQALVNVSQLCDEYSISNQLPDTHSAELLRQAFFDGDHELVAVLAKVSSAKSLADPGQPMQAAIANWAKADLDLAQTQMEAAWEAATERASEIAEGIALLATEVDQPMIQVEAYQRALQMQPSPTRRAALALAQLDSGEVQAASQTLQNSGQSTFELIAQGAIQLAMGQPDEASKCFEAIDSADLPNNPIWGQRLVAGLKEISGTASTLQVVGALVERYPTNAYIRQHAIEIYSRAGQPAKALEQAQTLALLQPFDPASKQLLAEALQGNDQPGQALDLWLELADELPVAKAKVVAAALAAGKIDIALTFSQKLVEADPHSASARLALGNSLIRAGNAQGGIVHIRRATEIDPAQSKAWMSLAEAQIGEGMIDAAGDTLAEAAQVIPENGAILSAYSGWLQDQERLTESLEAIEQASQLDPDNIAHSIQQANLLIQMGQTEEAKPLLEAVVRQQPTNWAARTSLANIHESAGNAAAALDLLQGLPQSAEANSFALLARSLIGIAEEGEVEIGQRSLEALAKASAKGYSSPDHDYWRARALHLAGQFDEALQLYQAAMKSLPPTAADLRSACLQGQAQAAIASDQVPVAISLLERARQSGEIQPQSLALLSQAYLTAGLAEESLEPAIEAVHKDPSDSVIRKQYLVACKANGGAEQALEAINDWIKQDATASELLFEKAELHAELGQTVAARDALAELAWESRHQPADLDRIANQLIAIDQPKSAMHLLANADYQEPDQPARLEALAQTSQSAGEYQAAADAWSKVLRLEPENIAALLGSAEANWQLDQRMAAIGLWQRAVTIEPERADLHARLARAQLANGETSQALDHFRSAAEIAPQDKRIRLEAAQALMANHSCSQALDLLNNGLSQDIEPQVDELGLLAQIYLGLGRPQEAKVTIARAPGDSSSAKLEALASLANSRLGQPEHANEKLESAINQQLTTIDEAIWVARAALDLGNWQAALEIAEAGAIITTDAAQAAELQLAVKCRLADAYTLMTTFGSAQHHAPSAAMIGESAFRELSNLIDTLEQAGRPKSQVEAWTTRVYAAFGREHTLGGQLLQSLPTDHIIRQQANEGLALTQLEAENPEGALRTLAAAPESLQAGPWSPLIAGLAHLKLQRPEVARKAFGAVEKTSPFWPLAAFLVGKCWHNEARIDEAINSWNAAVLEWPGEIRWQSELALAYRQLEKPEAALPHLQTALEAAPEQHDLRLPLARSYFELGEISQAVKQYQLVLPQFQEDPEILTEIGQALLTNGQAEQAYHQFQAALTLAPENLAAEVGAAQAAWQQGDERLAEKHSAKAMRRQPRQAELLVALTEILLAAGHGGRALALLEEAYGHSKPPAAIARLKAKAHFDMGRAQESISLLKQVVDDDPEDDVAWAAMAKGHASANQAGQAIDALRLALNLRPGHKPYRIQLARLYRETGQLDQALDELSGMQNDDPADHRIPLEIGLVHRARRQLQQALAAFQQSISLNESSASAYFQAGMAFKALKAYPQSVEMLEKAVSLNPKDSEAMHQLAAVQALQLVHGGIQASAVST